MSDDNQMSIYEELGEENDIEKEWHNMPEFVQEDKSPAKQLIVSFKNFEDYKEFSKLINQPLTKQTQSVWFPPVEIERYMDKRYTTDES